MDRRSFILTFSALCAGPVAIAQQRQQQRRSSGGKATGAGGSSPGEVLIRFPGTLRSITKKQILIELENEQELIFRRTKKTRFLNDDKAVGEEAAPVGSKIVVEGQRELNGDLDAVNVIWNEKPRDEKPNDRE